MLLNIICEIVGHRFEIVEYDYIEANNGDILSAEVTRVCGCCGYSNTARLTSNDQKD